ncbi:MAG: hypothetical protein M3O31_00610 [Acidobacteriota bacterium]|nr:hypothetical protein [Acidobacteriota bacterium]
MTTDNRIAFANDAALKAELTKILESGALFRTLKYSAELHAFSSVNSNYVHIPKTISRDCDVCKMRTAWECGSTSCDIETRFHLKSYKCRNCDSRVVRFAIIWWTNREVVLFEKFGEYPKPEIEIPSVLEDRLGKDDSSLYRRALISQNISHGIAAVAYARRVVENKVDVLLDLVIEAAKLSGSEDPHLAEAAAVKASYQVDRKIELASLLLPAHLRPGGHNPLSTLYSNLSNALHNKSDTECLAVFDEFRFLFEYLFRNLTTENAEAANFAERFSAKVSKAQSAKAGKPASTAPPSE